MSLTIAAATTIAHDLTAFAVEISQQAVPTDQIKIFSDRPMKLSAPHEWIPIASDFSRYDYCRWCLHDLNQNIDTDHVLIVQYDGMAVNRDSWQDSFLDYDYIGGVFSQAMPIIASCVYGTDPEILQRQPWFHDRSYRVGNGGFSLRSKKLLTALANDPEFCFPWNDIWIEDYLISFVFRERLERHHGIRYAPCDVGLAFSHEHIGYGNLALGFHGWQRALDFFPDDICQWYLSQLIPWKLNPANGGLAQALTLSLQRPVIHRWLQDMQAHTGPGVRFAY